MTPHTQSVQPTSAPTRSACPARGRSPLVIRRRGDTPQRPVAQRAAVASEAPARPVASTMSQPAPRATVNRRFLVSPMADHHYRILTAGEDALVA